MKSGNTIYICLLVVISIISHWIWFFTYDYLVWGDWGSYVYAETFVDYLNFSISWVSNGLGSANVTASFSPVLWLMGVFAFLDITFPYIERILILFPSILLLSVGSYLFIFRIVKSRIGAFCGSMVYSFNTYVLILQAGHLFLLMGVAIFPVAFLIYHKYLSSKKLQDSIILVIVLFTLSFFEFRIFYIFVFLIISFVFWQFYTLKKNIFTKGGIAEVFLAFSPLVIVGILNMYWLIGMLKLNTVSENVVFSRQLFGGQYLGLLWSTSLFHSFWSGNKLEIFLVNQMPWYYLLIPIFAFMGFLSNRKNTFAVFFGVVALVGIFLTKQTDFPLRDIYPWLYKNFPGFNAFREASKFYILISLSYAVLIGFFVTWLGKLRGKLGVVFYIVSFFIMIIFLYNTKPLITGEYGNLFVSRYSHDDYLKFRELIKKDQSFYRSIWYPTDPRWVYSNNDHPRLSAFNFLNKISHLIDGENKKNDSNKIYSPKELMHNFLSFSSVRYVAVPISDMKNDDDVFKYYGGEEDGDIRNWYISELDKLDCLEKIDIGTEELVVYENKNYKPHIFSIDRINGLKSFKKLEEKYLFINDELKNDFIFYDLNKKDIVSENVFVPFEVINYTNIGTNTITDFVGNNNEISKLFVNSEEQNFVVNYQNSNLNVNKIVKNNLNINDGQNGTKREATKIYQKKTFGQDIFIETGSRLRSVENNSEPIDLGVVSNPFNIYGVDTKNAIKNASFEHGVWSKKVGDCNAYDDKPILAMELSDESVDGKISLQLEATNHIACTGQDGISVDGGQDYIFGFDYQGQNAKHAGYYLSFNNEDKTIISERLPIVNEEWNHFQKKISVPATSTSMSLVVYSYSDDNQTNIITRYDNFQLKQLEKIATVDPKYKPSYEKIDLAKADEYKIEYQEEGVSYDNLIVNPSFEKGLWSNKVGDCNNYDDNVKLSMDEITAEKTDGEHALQLGATRHIACTGPDMIPVIEERTYLFSFDFQSPNGESAGYYLGFNDPEQTVISERLPIKDKTWQNYTKQIKIPFGASAVSLVVYSYAGDGKKEIITRYDNFKLIQLPDLEDRYFLVTEPEEKFVEPKAVEFEMINPTKKKVHIKGATTPFYLAMSESYHDQWQLQMNNGKINGFFASWIPWVKPDRVADDKHFELDGFLNGWFVEPEKLCEGISSVIDDNTPRPSGAPLSRGEFMTEGVEGGSVESYKVESKNNNKDATSPAPPGHPLPEGEFMGCALNADGSYDLEMVIEFFPQRWFYLGLLISGTTFAGCVGYLGWYYIRRRKAGEETRMQ